jgi:hypothetical protein
LRVSRELRAAHDEIVYGKRSLIGKKPGDEWQRFANLPAYFAFVWPHPGEALVHGRASSRRTASGTTTSVSIGSCSVSRCMPVCTV